ncbi:MAG TPA: prepilin-type N-terminal cleavage/methylation domain-containing protein, partial [Longimicrobium sp.]|nr:prepilin-type N-terminal cleavage/methylation domain-containing protein [Longimicrobium sp.]
MPRPIRNSRGFTGIEILIVLAVVGVLAGVGYAGTIQYRAYAAEAGMRQDLVHFVNQQQVFRQRTGALGTMRQLHGIGFRRSPGVVVEESRLHGGGRRAYLRVRHVKTGQRCSVDYSPFVSNALNRVQCWAGPNDPASTETVAATDENPTPGGTTIAVDTPIVAPVPPHCAGVPVLGIASPADETGATPGTAGTGTFTLSNPGAAPRSYNLRFSSSNPAVVPSVAGPGSVAVPAGASRSVAASFQVAAGAESGQVAVLPLEATDVDCPSLTTDGFFAVSARLMLMPPAMTTPPDLTVIPGQAADVAWSTTNRVNATRMLQLAAAYPSTLVRESAVGLGSIPFARGEAQATQLRLRLSDRVDGFTPHRVCLTATDQEAPSYDAERCMTITAAFQPRPPAITAASGARTELPNAVFTQTWTVTNNSNAPRDFRVTLGQSGDLTLRSPNPAQTVRIGRDQSTTVTATYQVSGTSLHRTASTTTLTVADPGAPDQSTSSHTSNVTTGLALAHPTVTSAPDATADPGESGRLTYSLRNNTNEDRTFSFTYASSHAGAAAATATPARVTVPAYGSVPVEGPFSVPPSAEGGWAANFTLIATDVLATSYSGSGGGKVAVNTVLAAPTIIDPPSCPSGDPGASGTLAYSLRNNSNVARTFGFTFTSGATHAATPTGTPAGITVPAFATVAVNGPWAIPPTAQGGWTATLTLTGRDAAATSLAGSGRCVVTVNTVLLPPTVSAGSGVTGSYGQWAHIPFAITNRSNVTRSFVLTPSAGNPPIVAAFGQLGTITLPAFGSTSVNLPLQFSATPAANLASAITLTATDAASGTLTSAATSGATRINAAPSVSPTFTPDNVPRGTTITAYSNASDSDGVIAAVHWWTNSPSGARVYRGNAPHIAFIPNEVGAWILSAQAIDNNNEQSAAVTTSALTVVNRAPTAVLRVTYPRPEGFIYNDEVAQLDLHQSSDPDGDPLTGSLAPGGMTGTWTPPARPDFYGVTAGVSDWLPEGTATDTISIEVRGRVYGCMDANALNYVPEANTPTK